METLRTETVHTTDSIHSTLSCINVQDIKETSKECEEGGLLYGADEDDALSDDSLRLRVSDDEEIEAEDAVTSVKVMNEDNKPKSSMTGMVPGNSGPGIESEKDPSESKEAVIKNGGSTSEIPDKEGRETGNIPLNETTMSESPRNRNTSEGRPYGSAIGRQFPVPRPNGHDNRRRFLPMTRNRPYRPENHISYMRPHYYAQNEMYRAIPENYWNNPRNYSGFHTTVFSHKYGRYSGNSYDAWPSYSPKRSKEHNRKDPPKDSTTSSTNIAQSKTKETEHVEHAEPEEIKDVEIVQDVSKVSNVAENKVDTEGEVETNKDAHEDNENVKVSSTVEIVSEISNNATDERSENHEEKDNVESPTECTSTSRNNDESSIALKKEKSDDNNEDNETRNVDESIHESTELPENDDVNCTVINVDVKCKNDDEETINNDLGTNNTHLADSTELCDDSKTEKTETESVTKQSDQTEDSLQLKQDRDNSVNEETDKVETQKDVETTVISSEVSPKKEEMMDVENEVEKEKNDSESHQVSDVVEKSALNETEASSSSVKSSKSNITDDDSSVSDGTDEPKSILRKQLKRSALIKRTVSNKTTLKVFNVDSDTTDNVTSTDDSSSVGKDKTLPSATGERKTSDSETKRAEESIAPQRRRRRTKRMTVAAQEAADRQETQVLGLENGRQKRRTAKNAAEIIRKRFLDPDSDLESSDDSDKFVMVNSKSRVDEKNARSLSPPSLKRPCLEITSAAVNGNLKKAKIMSDETNKETRPLPNDTEKIKNLSYARKFFQRDFKGRIPKLKPQELEELLIQMIAEVITNRSEMGKLREQARVSVRNQETLRTRCQQLAKQIKDMEMVLNRNAADRRANNDKPTAPIKINRSVGLQVNIMSSEYGIQNLRQIQTNTGSKTAHATSSLSTSATEVNSNNTTPRRGLKVRSPRRSDSSVTPQSTMQNQIPTSPLISAVNPTTLVVTKPGESLPNQANNVQKMLPVQSPQTVIINGKIPNTNNRQSTSASTLKATSNDLIDLTDEEEKSKQVTSTDNPVTILPIPSGHMKPHQSPTQTPPQPCYQRVIQTIPTSVAITNQSSIRVVQPAVQPTPTALVNNMSAPRVAYVMQGNGPPRQLLIASNSNPIRPTTPCRPPFTTVTYKTGIQTIANGSVRVLTTPATSNIQSQKHPAPLPDTPTYMVNSAWKLPPPAPSLKISKHSNGTQKGIVLSWNMALTDKHAEIASYQLYAYQEMPGMLPSTSLWKKVGDVRALPLPMACTLTQFSESNTYYFAVRAVDTHSRKGQYSHPGNISL